MAIATTMTVPSACQLLPSLVCDEPDSAFSNGGVVDLVSLLLEEDEAVFLELLLLLLPPPLFLFLLFFLAIVVVFCRQLRISDFVTVFAFEMRNLIFKRSSCRFYPAMNVLNTSFFAHTLKNLFYSLVTRT